MVYDVTSQVPLGAQLILTARRQLTADSFAQDSFTHVNDWLNEVNRYASEGTCKLLVGNKSDRPEKVVQHDIAKVRTLQHELRSNWSATTVYTPLSIHRHLQTT